MVEHTVELAMSTNNTVIIPTAGLGSRIKSVSKELNKALLPFKGKPVLAHIIDQFPNDTRFIIPIGYKADQIKNFCNLVYNDRNIEFVEIDDYTSKDSGPGYTVSKCLHLIDNPFWYIPCDTFFEENIVNNFQEDVVFVKQVSKNISDQYTMFKINQDRITDITFKQTQDETWSAFTGVMYIHDWSNFSHRLTNQNTPEIIWAIKLNTKAKQLTSWQDFGNVEIYKNFVSANQKYDFTKSDEFTYVCNGKVIKWWADSSIPKKKFEKTLSNTKVYPSNCQFKDSFLVYDYFDGTTVYENYSIEILNNMLTWLDKDVWIHKVRDISSASNEFYKEKTLNRVKKFLEKYPEIEDVKTINGVNVKSWKYYLNNINWKFLEEINLPGHMHGDLQFDNVIVKDSEFKIIDWRHEFANLVEIGDIYYDLAKLSGGFIINYAKIKQNEFDIDIVDNHVKLKIPSIENYQTYLDTVNSFIHSKGWSRDKVQLLIPIIFWNMAPLHTPPFDKFLWYLGIKLFEELEL